MVEGGEQISKHYDLIFTQKLNLFSRMYYFILHLSLADLLTAFLTLLPEVVWTFTSPYFYGGSALCKMVKFGQMIGPYLSSYVLIMTAVDRFVCSCDKTFFILLPVN